MTVSAAIWILSKNNEIASKLYTLFAPSLCHAIGHALRKKKIWYCGKKQIECGLVLYVLVHTMVQYGPSQWSKLFAKPHSIC